MNDRRMRMQGLLRRAGGASRQLAILALAGLVAGCAWLEGTQEEAKHPGTEAAQQGGVVRESREAARAVAGYAFARKSELVAKTRKELVEIRDDLDRIYARVDRSGEAANADVRAQLDAVRGKLYRAQQRLEQAEGASESTWDDVKIGLRESYVELEDSFDDTREWLAGKIAP